MNYQLKIKILKKFRTQADFAKKVKMSESLVSRVVNGRRLLTEKEAAKWQEALKPEA